MAVAANVAPTNNELILKAATTYRFLIESDAADNIISYCGEWYEHTPKN